MVAVCAIRAKLVSGRSPRDARDASRAGSATIAHFSAKPISRCCSTPPPACRPGTVAARENGDPSHSTDHWATVQLGPAGRKMEILVAWHKGHPPPRSSRAQGLLGSREGYLGHHTVA